MVQSTQKIEKSVNFIEFYVWHSKTRYLVVWTGLSGCVENFQRFGGSLA